MGFDASSYASLEPNHEVQTDASGQRIVVCPFEVLEDGQVTAHDHPVIETATWSAQALNDEIECPVCVTFKGEARYVGAPGCATFIEGEAE